MLPTLTPVRCASSLTFAGLMPVLGVRAPRLKKLFPGGDVYVHRLFPPALTARETSPFLFCDIIGPSVSTGALFGDAFPTPWHPHAGHDVLTYLTAGVGRHADSLGNRGTYASPGMQWISVGSGVEHAEGGGTPLGEVEAGFQLWINVPARRKNDPPRYGLAQPSDIPELTLVGGASVRVLAGSFEGATGPFETAQPVMILDVRLPAGATLDCEVSPVSLNTVLCHAHLGGRTIDAPSDEESSAGRPLLSVNGSPVALRDTAILDAGRPDGPRGLSLQCATGGPGGASVLLLAGVRLDEPLAWRGTFTLNSEAALAATEQAASSAVSGSGSAFPPVRTPWDYKSLAAFPIDHPSRLSCGEGELR